MGSLSYVNFCSSSRSFFSCCRSWSWDSPTEVNLRKKTKEVVKPIPNYNCLAPSTVKPHQFCSWSKQTLVIPPMQDICWRRFQSASSVEMSSNTTWSRTFNNSDIWVITFCTETQTVLNTSAQSSLRNDTLWKFIWDVHTILMSFSLMNMEWMFSLSRFRSSFEMIPFSSSVKQMSLITNLKRYRIKNHNII